MAVWSMLWMIWLPWCETHYYFFFLTLTLTKFTLYFSLFKSNLMETRSKWRIQEDRKTSRKSNQDNKFPPIIKCCSWKTNVWNQYTKNKGLHHVSYILFVKTASLKMPQVVLMINFTSLNHHWTTQDHQLHIN